MIALVLSLILELGGAIVEGLPTNRELIHSWTQARLSVPI